MMDGDTYKEHPKDFCDWCGTANPVWYADNDLWNEITGNQPGLVICPKCFETRCQEFGLCVIFFSRSVSGKIRIYCRESSRGPMRQI